MSNELLDYDEIDAESANKIGVLFAPGDATQVDTGDDSDNVGNADDNNNGGGGDAAGGNTGGGSGGNEDNNDDGGDDENNNDNDKNNTDKNKQDDDGEGLGGQRPEAGPGDGLGNGGIRLGMSPAICMSSLLGALVFTLM